MKTEYVYITETHIGGGEYAVAGRLSDGTLNFGFKTFDYWGRRDKARDYAGKRIPVFGNKGPLA